MEFQTSDFKNFIELQEFENKIRNEEEKIKKINSYIGNILQEEDNLKSELNELKKTFQTLNIEKNKLETDLISIEEQIKKLQIELNQTKKVEQYNLINSQINKLKEEKDNRETKVLEIIEEIEEIKKQINEKSKTFEEKVKIYEKEIKNLENEKDKITKNIEQLNKQKNDIKLRIMDKKLLSKFEDLLKTKNRVAITIAKLVKREDNNEMIYVCHECKMKLTKSDIDSLNKFNTFIVCQNCSRLLYMEGVKL